MRWPGGLRGLGGSVRSQKGIRSPSREVAYDIRMKSSLIVVVFSVEPTSPTHTLKAQFLLRLLHDDDHVGHTLESQVSLGEGLSSKIPQGSPHLYCIYQ